MQIILFKILVTCIAFITMEAVAWSTHKYIMHGFLWNLHRDHHVNSKKHRFERNDFFFLIFAIPGILLIFIGYNYHWVLQLYAGLGIAFYGITYFLVHDIFIHQRIKIFKKSDSIYLRGIRRAHKVHHRHLTKEKGECFGMLWVPFRFFRKPNVKNDFR
jgi:beta-carotene 3-hydroxylase